MAWRALALASGTRHAHPVSRDCAPLLAILWQYNFWCTAERRAGESRLCKTLQVKLAGSPPEGIAALQKLIDAEPRGREAFEIALNGEEDQALAEFCTPSKRLSLFICEGVTDEMVERLKKQEL